MNEASLDTSPRLQRVMDILADGRPHSTMEIIRGAAVCAVNSIVSELRRNGYRIVCRVESRQERGRRGRRWLYQLQPSFGTCVEIPASAAHPAATMIYG